MVGDGTEEDSEDGERLVSYDEDMKGVTMGKKDEAREQWSPL
jgi:hypothetical protein